MLKELFAASKIAAALILFYNNRFNCLNDREEWKDKCIRDQFNLFDQCFIFDYKCKLNV